MDPRIALAALLLTLGACNGPQAPAPAPPEPPAAAPAEPTPASADTIRDGHQRQLDDQGRLLMEGDLRDGKRQGLWTAYHKNGQVQSRNTYSNGLREGPAVVFRTNGALYYKGQYANDHPVGEWLFHDEIGTLVRTVVYDSAGVEVK